MEAADLARWPAPPDPSDSRPGLQPPALAWRGAEPERWRDKHGIAEHFVCSVRWIEARMAEGLPHTMIAGRAKFRVSEVEAWLELRGHIEHCGETVAA